MKYSQESKNLDHAYKDSFSYAKRVSEEYSNMYLGRLSDSNTPHIS